MVILVWISEEVVRVGGKLSGVEFVGSGDCWNGSGEGYREGVW